MTEKQEKKNSKKEKNAKQIDKKHQNLTEKTKQKDAEKKKDEIKKDRVKKNEAEKEFFDDTGFNESDDSVKLFQSDSEEELEEIINQEPRRRFRFAPVAVPQSNDFEEIFEEPNVTLEQNLKDVPSKNQETNLISSYAITKDMNYGINKYSAKTSYEPSGMMSTSPLQKFEMQIQPQNQSAWKDMSNTEPTPKPKMETGRNRDYEPKAEKRRDVW